MNDLLKMGQRWGIEAGYHDVSGTWHEVQPDTLRRLVEALSKGQDQPPAAEFPPLPDRPRRCWQGDGRRLWGIATQLYAVRSQRNWGHGDFTDLRRLVEAAGAVGASAIGLNPLHALFPDRPEQASPYAPNSRLFLNPLYIDVEAIPEFPGRSRVDDEIGRLREGDIVDYAGVASAKLKGLRIAYGRFAADATQERRLDFEAYRAEQGDALLRFACFETLRRRYAPKPWWKWPEPWCKPAIETLERFRSEERSACEFEEFVQWTADRQLRACMEAANSRGMPIGLYIDLAVGINPVGADAWSFQDLVLSDVSIGAPPDEFNRNGQDWGLAPFNPSVLHLGDFASVRRLMSSIMRYAGAIRLDHVLGLKRVFMIPRGLIATAGAYVRSPFEPLLKVIGEESCRHRCIVIGEDLGTVPEGFRDVTHKWGVWTTRVMMFERERDGRFRSPARYPADALATFNTHDLPTFQGWMTAHDLRAKRALGIDPGESEDARAGAVEMLGDALKNQVPACATDTFAAVAAFLAETPCKLVVVALEDIVGQLDQVNVPGTTTEHPNWRRKLSVPLEALSDHSGIQEIAKIFRRAERSFEG